MDSCLLPDPEPMGIPLEPSAVIVEDSRHPTMPKKNPKTKVTIVELSKLLKLSPRAVSQVLNGGGSASSVRVNPKTRERVERVAREVGYRPNRGAQMFRTGKHPGLVGMLSSQGFDPALANRTYFAQSNAEKNGLFLCPYFLPSLDHMERAVDFFLDAGVEAVVSFQSLKEAQLSRLLENGIRVLSIGAQQEIRVPSYFVDKEEGFAMLTRHMIEQGRTRLALILGCGRSWAHGADAERGFLRAVAEGRKQNKGLKGVVHLKEVPIEGCMAPDYPEVHGILVPGYAAMKEILDSKEIPDAVVCSNDTLVQGAIRACMEAGISLPKQIAIGGFGDEPLSTGGMMTLTTLHQPLDELCEMAFDDLKRSLVTKEPLPEREVRLPCSLIVRESTKNRRR
jgi:LacI family transcriptional regulator